MPEVVGKGTTGVSLEKHLRAWFYEVGDEMDGQLGSRHNWIARVQGGDTVLPFWTHALYLVLLALMVVTITKER